MQTRFIHTADVHLGNHQYHNDERYNDFSRAFNTIVDDAIARRVDFFLVAGDIFHKRAIDALTLYQAKDALSRLREVGIPVLAIEGNHDKAYYRDAGVSWLSFLSWTGDVILLAATIEEGGLRLSPWSRERRTGAYYDIPGRGIRVYGVPWFGASTAPVITQLAAELQRTRADEEAEGVRYRVAMLHTGVEGIVPALHGLPTRMQFEPLRGLVDYVALGHVHKPYAIDDFLYNPGSTETVSAEEFAWERGYYVVTVDPDATPRHQAEHTINPKRPFLRWHVAVDGITSPESLTEQFAVSAARHARQAKFTNDLAPVADVALTGMLAFDASALDKKLLETIAQEQVTQNLRAPLLVLLRNMTQSLDFVEVAADLDARDRANWHVLEQTIFRDLLVRDARFAPDAEAWSRVVADLKQHALNGDDPAVIAQWLRDARARIDAERISDDR